MWLNNEKIEEIITYYATQMQTKTYLLCILRLIGGFWEWVEKHLRNLQASFLAAVQESHADS